MSMLNIEKRLKALKRREQPNKIKESARTSFAREFKLYDSLWSTKGAFKSRATPHTCKKGCCSSLFNEDFLSLYEELSSLNEAKADTQRLIDFAGEDLANRFINIKDKLKAPENDLYYWIKNKTVDELEQAIIAAESAKSSRQLARDVADAGAELVCETAHWKVYHITTYEASQKYGRDSRWCITGINNYGDQYWKSYTAQGVKFYFFITKQDYDPRGTDSKFALAIYPNGDMAELFDQQDNKVGLDDMPHYGEINIPGIDLESLSIFGEDEEEGTYCYVCGVEVDPDEAFYDFDVGAYYCDDCFDNHFFDCDECQETISRDRSAAFVLPDDRTVCETCMVELGYDTCPDCAEAVMPEELITTIFGDTMCQACYDLFLQTDKGYAELLFHLYEGYSEGDFLDKDEIDKAIKCWNLYKASLDPKKFNVKEIEQGFIENALDCDNVIIDPKVFNTSTLDAPANGKDIVQNILTWIKANVAKFNDDYFGDAAFEILDFYENEDEIGFKVEFSGILLQHHNNYLKETITAVFNKQDSTWKITHFRNDDTRPIDWGTDSTSAGIGFEKFLDPGIYLNLPSPKRGTSTYNKLYKV